MRGSFGAGKANAGLHFQLPGKTLQTDSFHGGPGIPEEGERRSSVAWKVCGGAFSTCSLSIFWGSRAPVECEATVDKEPGALSCHRDFHTPT